jgi:hypothetical protein
MAELIGPLDDMLCELLETYNQRYDFEFDRKKRVIKFYGSGMIAIADEHGDNLVVVSYERGRGDMESEFCTPGQAAALIEAVMSRKELCRLPKFGKPPLLVMEFAKGASKALALEFYPENVDAFEKVLPNAKSALARWKARNGNSCEAILFTIVSAAEQHAAIEAVIERACRGQAELAPLLKALEIRVSLWVDPRGEPVREYVLDKPSSGIATKAKPWWRFW